MKLTTILTTGALALATLAACERTPSPIDPTIATLEAGGAIQPTRDFFVAFTKLPAGYAEHTIAAGPDVQLMTFQIDASRTKDVGLAQLQFMIFGGMLDGSGALPAGYLTNFRLLYYPKGLGGGSTVVASNDASTWTPGHTPDTFLPINLTPAFAFKQNFTGVFALVADVNGGPARFQPNLQVASVDVGGVQQPLLNPTTCDLPLAGDGFIVQ